MAAICYRCGICGREFANSMLGMFLDHMRACSSGVTSVQQPPKAKFDTSSSSCSEDEDTRSTTNNTVTDNHSESSSLLHLPRKRGRPSRAEMALRNQLMAQQKLQQQQQQKSGQKPVQKTVFLNRTQSKPKEVRQNQDRTSLVTTMPLLNATKSQTSTISEEEIQRLTEEILSGKREAIIKISNDVDIEQLIVECMQSDDRCAKLPAKYQTKRPFFGPKIRNVSGYRPPPRPPQVNLFCKLCGEHGFETDAELQAHFRYCSSDQDFHKKRRRRGDLSESDEEYRPSSRNRRETGQMPDIPPEEQFCWYCRKSFDMWSKLKRHLLQNCQERRRLAQRNELPEDDQLLLVEEELKKKRTAPKPPKLDSSFTQGQVTWNCEYCSFVGQDGNDLVKHLQKDCDRRLQMLEDDELLAHEDQLNRLKKLPPNVRKTLGVGQTQSEPRKPRRESPILTPKGMPRVKDGDTQCPACQRMFPTHKSVRNHLVYCKVAKGELTLEQLNALPPAKSRPSKAGLSKLNSSSSALQTDETKQTRRVTKAQQAEIAGPQLPVQAQCEGCGQVFDISQGHQCPVPCHVILEGYQGEEHLYLDEGLCVGEVALLADRQKGPEMLLEELANISPLGEDLFEKARKGLPMELSPPPLCLPPGFQLVEVYDANGYVFKVPYNTTVDQNTALSGVIEAIAKRQQALEISEMPEQFTEAAQFNQKLLNPTQQVSTVEPETSQLDPDFSFSSSSEDDDEDDEDYEMDFEDMRGAPPIIPKKQPQQPVPAVKSSQSRNNGIVKVPQMPANASEEFIASADWVRRQNAMRQASGGRRVKASTRYLE